MKIPKQIWRRRALSSQLDKQEVGEGREISNAKKEENCIRVHKKWSLIILRFLKFRKLEYTQSLMSQSPQANMDKDSNENGKARDEIEIWFVTFFPYGLKRFIYLTQKKLTFGGWETREKFCGKENFLPHRRCAKKARESEKFVFSLRLYWSLTVANMQTEKRRHENFILIIHNYLVNWIKTLQQRSFVLKFLVIIMKVFYQVFANFLEW